MYHYYPLFTREYMKVVFAFGGIKTKIKVFTLRLDKAQLESLAYGDYTWEKRVAGRVFVFLCVCARVIMLLTMK